MMEAHDVTVSSAGACHSPEDPGQNSKNRCAQQLAARSADSRDDAPQQQPRKSGVLLHPTCFASPGGIGDLGPAAFAFIDQLQAAQQQRWQVLPLGPPALAGCPYSTLSAIAGNPLLISLDLLARAGWWNPRTTLPEASASPVDFEQAARTKLAALREAFQGFPSSADDSFRAFCAEQADWLDDYALFMALRDAHAGAPWFRWPAPFLARQPEALLRARRELAHDIALHQFTQYVFYAQWTSLRAYAHQRGIQIVGDIPIYVAHNSVDVWKHSRNFAIDPATGAMAHIGGVPPDCFSETGQFWDVPVYNWEYLESTNFAWWVDRVRKLSQLVDVVRIDHFRGLAAFWQIPQGAQTAVEGQWVAAPGTALLTTLRAELGDLAIWAEDLGLITPDVEHMRDAFDLPGMKILQFAFDAQRAANPYLPCNYDRNCVCYTGTHDNNTTRGWWAELEDSLQRQVLDYLGVATADEIHWSLIRLASSSVANDVMIPWQDILGLGREARFNIPGTTTGNWNWRFAEQAVTAEMIQRLAQLTTTYGRAPEQQQPG